MGDADVVVALPARDGVVPERPGEIEPAQSVRLMFRCPYKAASLTQKKMFLLTVTTSKNSTVTVPGSEGNCPKK